MVYLIAAQLQPPVNLEGTFSVAMMFQAVDVKDSVRCGSEK
jgi:hypothetical protein